MTNEATGQQHPDKNVENLFEPTQVKVPVLEEKVDVTKVLVEQAKVTLSKKVHEEVQQLNIPVMEEQVVVQRYPKNEMVADAAPQVRYEGDVMIIPVLKEVAVVEKKMMLVEEIHVSKKTTIKTETREVPVRTEELHVDRKEIAPTQKFI